MRRDVYCDSLFH